MALGLETAICWALTFGCQLAAMTHPALSLPWMLLVVLAIVHPAYILARYNAVWPLTFSRTLWLMLLSLLCCAFVTTVLQGFYFFFFDNGHFATQLSNAVEMVQIENIVQVSSADVKAALEQLAVPRVATQTVLSYNVGIAMLLLLPCTLTSRLMMLFTKDRNR